MPEDKDLRRARNYALRLFKVRARSEKELKFRLRQKKFSQKVIDLAIESFKKIGYINDVDFAHNWVRRRIDKPLGLKRLEFELRQKGIDSQLIESVLTQAKEEYPEYEIVSKLLKDKFKKTIDKELDCTTKIKIQGYLLRRGFSPDVVIDAINNL